MVQVLIAKITIFKSRFVVYALIKIAISIGFTANRCGIDTVQTNGRVIDQVAGSHRVHRATVTYILI